MICTLDASSSRKEQPTVKVKTSVLSKRATASYKTVPILFNMYIPNIPVSYNITLTCGTCLRIFLQKDTVETHLKLIPLWPTRCEWCCLNLPRPCTYILSILLCLRLLCFCASTILEKDSWFLSLTQRLLNTNDLGPRLNAQLFSRSLHLWTVCFCFSNSARLHL